MIGSYEDLLKNGFDADEILQNYNQSLKQKEDIKNENNIQKQDRTQKRDQAIQKLKTITEQAQ